jgi:hypothetical protein
MLFLPTLSCLMVELLRTFSVVENWWAMALIYRLPRRPHLWPPPLQAAVSLATTSPGGPLFGRRLPKWPLLWPTPPQAASSLAAAPPDGRHFGRRNSPHSRLFPQFPGPETTPARTGGCMEVGEKGLISRQTDSLVLRLPLWLKEFLMERTSFFTVQVSVDLSKS